MVLMEHPEWIKSENYKSLDSSKVNVSESYKILHAVNQTSENSNESSPRLQSESLITETSDTT